MLIGKTNQELRIKTTENTHTESYLSEKSVRCFFDCVCKCVCKWRHRVKYTEGYLSEKSVRCFCDYCVCKWRVQMDCTCVPPQARIQAVAKVARATVRFFPPIFCINLFEDIRLNILRFTLYSYNNKNLGNFMSYFF